MRHLFIPGLLVGVAVLAIWVHVCFPRIEPRSLRLAFVHIAVSIVLFHFVPVALYIAARVLPLPLSVIVAVTLILVPTLCYVLLSWLWLLARLRDLTRTPRGGHPVRSS